MIISSFNFLTETKVTIDSKFTLEALAKLDLRFGIDIYSALTPLKLQQLKDKVLFDLKANEVKENIPVENVYLASWLSDEKTSCKSTWRNFLAVLNIIGLGELAKKILDNLFSSCSVGFIAGKRHT